MGVHAKDACATFIRIRRHVANGPSACGCYDAPWVPTEPSVFVPAPPLPSGARPDWAMRAAQQSAVVYVASGLACPRPSPVINAQRYSKPEWTW